MWLGIWAIILDLFILLPILYRLRGMSRKEVICIVYILHHCLQNFDKGYGWPEATRDIAKVKDYV